MSGSCWRLSVQSVEALFKAVGTVDHVVFAAGTGHVGPLATMTPADVMKSIDGKRSPFEPITPTQPMTTHLTFCCKSNTPLLRRAGKFMSQVRVTLTAQKYLSPGGSIALTSGLLEFEPMPKFASLSAVNAALRGWVAGVALELKNGCRINCVSPGLLAASETVYGKLFPGFKGISPEQVGRAYLRCLFGGITGRTLLVVAESWRSS